MLIVQIYFVLIVFCSLSQSKNSFMPNLPMGEYRIVYEKIYPCKSTISNLIQFNIQINKKSLNASEVKGNVTFLIPLDDTLTVDIKFSSWGSTGGWVSNAYVINIKKACSNIKNLLGNAWLNIIKDLKIPSHSCPIPMGTYLTSGLELKKLEDQNFPKVFFYGKYKSSLTFSNAESKVVSCIIFELNILRPWETQN